MRSIKSPWQATFDEFVDGIRESALIAAPYITWQPIERLADRLRSPNSVRLDVLTSLDAPSMCSGAVDAAALAWLCERIPNANVRHLANLHAKAYVADADVAIVGSANLTTGGLRRNYELGVYITEPQAVSDIADDLREYGRLGVSVPADALLQLDAMARRGRRVRADIDESAETAAKSEYDGVVEGITGKLVELSVEGDEFILNPRATITGKFGDALKYILRRHGALPTGEIYPLIQEIMPEWCDDDVRRVVKGATLDIKWRHDVLNAQQVLRRQGVIARENGRWRLIQSE